MQTTADKHDVLQNLGNEVEKEVNDNIQAADGNNGRVAQNNNYVRIRLSRLHLYNGEVPIFLNYKGKDFRKCDEKRLGYFIALAEKLKGVNKILSDIVSDGSSQQLARNFKPVVETIKESVNRVQFYISSEDRISGLKMVHKKLNNQLKEALGSGDLEIVRDTLFDTVSETFLEPRTGNLAGLVDTVSLLVNEFANNPNVLTQLTKIYSSDPTTSEHSINVMAFATGYALAGGSSQEQARDIGLAGLFHDIGKTRIPIHLLTADRRLTDKEFDIMKKHPLLGYKILKECESVTNLCLLAALQHQERMDGTGYPKALKGNQISVIGQLLMIIDCYEAMTCNDRPYRRAQSPFEVLGLLREETNAGKFNPEIFEKFVQTLGELPKFTE